MSPVPPSSPNFGSGSEGTGSGGVRRYTRRAKSGDDSMDSVEREEVLTPERIQQAHRFVTSLMEGPPNEAEESKVDFIQAAHKPRIFKAWVKEIADCVRDYFWCVRSSSSSTTARRADALRTGSSATRTTCSGLSSRSTPTRSKRLKSRVA